MSAWSFHFCFLWLEFRPKKTAKKRFLKLSATASSSSQYFQLKLFQASPSVVAQHFFSSRVQFFSCLRFQVILLLLLLLLQLMDFSTRHMVYVVSYLHIWHLEDIKATRAHAFEHVCSPKVKSSEVFLLNQQQEEERRRSRLSRPRVSAAHIFFAIWRWKKIALHFFLFFFVF